MIKLLAIETNMTNFFKLLMRGFAVDLNSACTQLIVQMPPFAPEVIAEQIAEALGVKPEELELINRGAGQWLVQPIEVPFVEVENV